MTKMKHDYSIEFKHEAASLVLDKKYTVSEACAAMGVGNTAMRRWVKQLDSERGGQTPKANAFTTDQRTIQSLEARIKQIEWENGILKKASALLISDTIRRSI